MTNKKNKSYVTWSKINTEDDELNKEEILSNFVATWVSLRRKKMVLIQILMLMRIKILNERKKNLI